MSTLGTQRTHRTSLHYPDSGGWRADVILESGASPAVGARLTLTLADLACVGTVLTSGDDITGSATEHARPHAVVVGGIGWETALADPPHYQNDNGVRLSTILQDLARRAKSDALPGGEPIELPPDLTIGDHWSCPTARPGEYLRVRDALAHLFEQGFVLPWRVDPDGVTRFGPRKGGAVTARATVLRRDLGVGLRVVGLDSPAAFLPGNTLEGAPIRRAVFLETAGALTADVWSDARLTFRSRVLRIVSEAFPALVYGYPRTYIVEAVGGDGRLSLRPPADAPHLRALPKVEAWAPYGMRLTPAVGSRVVVGFRDANPARPFVLAYEPVASPGPALARVTDHAGRFYIDSTALSVATAVYYAPSEAGAYALLTVGAGPPLPAAPGTVVQITTGSATAKST